MALITLRASTTSVGPASTAAKTTPLTNAEVDNNFINLNTDSALRMVVGAPWVSGATSIAVGRIIYHSSNLTSATPTINYYQVTASTTGTFSTTAPSHTTGSAVNGGVTLLWIAKPTYSGVDILNQLKLVDGINSGLDADLLDGLLSSSTNAINTVVTRDGSGNFAANVITAAGFTGPLTGNVTGNATTATNGVVTTGTYSNPAWITGLAGSKVTAIPNASLTNSTITINGTAVALGGSIDSRATANIWSALQTFRDSLFAITDQTDTTKVLNFELSALTTSTTRTLTAPANNGVIATEEYVQTAGRNSQGTKTISSAAPVNGVGSDGDVWYRV
jgi:hypothetical protein